MAWLGRTSNDEQQDPTLSLPRQLDSSRNALPAGMSIVAHFYDVETSRKDLAVRGSSTAWTRFEIPIARDGGIAELLAEAARPDRRFDAVICESIDRIARFTHQGTKIEHDLELLGVPLLASDEPIMLGTTATGHRPKRASQILLRRTKQGVAEWYIVEMLEKSWAGYAIHTQQGWNIGKPPYGYSAERHEHPVPARRAAGQHKTKLTKDPERGPTVQAIYDWRVSERLSYRAIADRLNTDLRRYPPPQPPDPERAIGAWSVSAVREVLNNPKYTGHMCWNRRARKDKLHPGKVNPVEQWVLSAEPTHPPLVSIDLFVAAQNVAELRRSTRSDPTGIGLNPHRQTKRIHALRSYVWCAPCNRRMFGRAVNPHTYYSCQPRDRPVPADHPGSISIPEYKLFDIGNLFFNAHLFGTDRQEMARSGVNAATENAAEEHDQKVQALRRSLTDIETRQDRMFRILEENDDPDGSLYKRAKQRHAELDRDRRAAAAELADLLHDRPEATPNDVELLSALPVQHVDLAEFPTQLLRQLFDAFDIRIDYDHRTQGVTFHATITGTVIPIVADLMHADISLTEPQMSALPRRGHR